MKAKIAVRSGLNQNGLANDGQPVRLERVAGIEANHGRCRRHHDNHVAGDRIIHVTTYASLRQYYTTFSEGNLPLLVVTGRGGTAKSTLAVEIVRDAIRIDCHVTACGLYRQLFIHRNKVLIIDDVDVGALSGNMEYIEASNRLWENATGKKIYITGGVGASHTKGEAFDEPYILPNLNAYSETCGAVANMLWNFRLGKFYKDAKYFDVLERTLYNAYLPASSIHGVGYFYTNPLADRGKSNRSGWFDPPCCPTNISRTTPSVPGYLYLTDENNLYVNLFMESDSKIEVGGRKVGVVQQTNYPWDGEVKFIMSVDKPSEFTVKIRVPGWAREEAIPLGLYSYMNKTDKGISLKVNGKALKVSMEKGYAVIQRKWQTDDVVTLSLPMEVRRVVSDDKVKENNGMVALERGPLVFCTEGVDNHGKTSNIILPDESKLSCRFVKDLVGGITVIEGKAKTIGKNGKAVSSNFAAIPYFAWLNRGKGEMDIWIPRNVFASKVLNN